MKLINPVLLISLFVLGSCSHGGHEHAHMHEGGDSTNAALNEKVMGIHDEVMPKTETLYNLKKKIQDTIAHTPSLKAEKKKEFEALVVSLDSTSQAMMNWMHTFNPKKDSADQEKSREYLESQIELLNKLKEQTNEIIEKAESATKH